MNMKMRPWNRTLIAAFVCALCLFALPQTGRADSATIDVNTDENLYLAVMSVRSGGTIRMTADIRMGSMFYNIMTNIGDPRDITLDLNGHTLSSADDNVNTSIEHRGSGKLTVQDSQGGGSILNTHVTAIRIEKNGKLAIAGGTIKATGGAGCAVIEALDSSSVTITGGTIEGEANSYTSCILLKGTSSFEMLGGGVKAHIKYANSLNYCHPVNGTGQNNVVISGGTLEATAGESVVTNVCAISMNAANSSLTLNGACELKAAGKAINGITPTVSTAYIAKASESAGGSPLVDYVPSDLAKYKYIQLRLIPSATMGDATIEGEKGYTIPASQTAAITLLNTKFNSLPVGTSVTSWFRNIPSGITAAIYGNNPNGSASAVVAFSGAPSANLSSPIQCVIPAQALTSGSDLTVNANANAKWSIYPARTASPQTATFDRYASSTGYQDKTFTLSESCYTLSAVKIGSDTLTAGTDYTVSGNNYTLLKARLGALGAGGHTITFVMSGGTSPTVTLTVTDTTPGAVTPQTAAFDRYASSTGYQDKTFTLSPGGYTLSAVKIGSDTLTAGTDYTVIGNDYTLLKSRLGMLGAGGHTITFVMSGGASPTVALTVTDTTPGAVSPQTATFDRYASSTGYQDKTFTLSPGGYTLSAVKIGSDTLTAGTDYTVSGNDYTLLKARLGALGAGGHTITFVMSGGASPTVTLTVTDTTLGAVSPQTATFDRYASSTGYQDKTFTLSPGGYTLSAVKIGSDTLTAGTDYTVSGNDYTLLKARLGMLGAGGHTITFVMSGGASPTVALTVTDTTPGAVSPQTAAFDRYASSTGYQDKTFTLSPGGYTLSAVKIGSDTLTAGTDYTVSGNDYTLLKGRLGALGAGGHTITFVMSGGASPTVTLTVTDTTPGAVSPQTAAFDRYASSTGYQDKTFTLSPGGYTLSAVKIGSDTLTAGTDYTVSGNDYTLLKGRLGALGAGDHTITFVMSGGASPTVALTVTDTTPAVSIPVLTPGTGVYTQDVHVSISCATSGATIRYTTDGSDPTAASPALASGTTLTVSGSFTIKAKAFHPGMPDSAIASARYTLTPNAVITGGSVSFPQGGAAGNTVFRIGENISRFNADNNYDHTEMAGRTLTNAEVTAVNGSIVLTFQQGFLDTLNTGTHTASVYLKGSGYAGTSVPIQFVVQPALVSTVPPKTGDGSMPELWLILCLLSCGLFALVYKRMADRSGNG